MKNTLKRALKIFNARWAVIGFTITFVIDFIIYLTKVKPSPYPRNTEEMWLFIVTPVVVAVIFGFLFTKDQCN